ncbi:hypothetical protein BC828DRAFT_400441 [Blastocladiella britannica]|nr:hypothetical protein BC828DRAFT_400441 [Blastocladiella britannica]
MAGHIQCIVESQYIISIEAVHMDKDSRISAGNTKMIIKVMLSIHDTLASDIGTQMYGSKVYYTFAVIDNAIHKTTSHMITGQFKTKVMYIWALTLHGVAATTVIFNSKAVHDFILAAGTFLCGYFCLCTFCDVMSAIQQMQVEAMHMLYMHSIPHDVMPVHLLQSAQHGMVATPELATGVITMTCSPTRPVETGGY